MKLTLAPALVGLALAGCAVSVAANPTATATATASATAAPDAPVLVRLDSGLARGEVVADVVRFRGIPFAAAPTGALRWRAPQPVPAWSGVLAADHFASPCMQVESPPAGAAAAAPPSEDCLYVNVWRPARRGPALPVMVWIYGGALLNGAASLPMYDGARFARHGVVLVSFNYRVGRFGFFAHPALSREAADGGRIANYGLMDQVAALAWVRRNIGVFGGDPRRVTIFGESAGAASVDALLVTRAARGLFQGAIAESGYGRSSFARLAAAAPDGKRPAEADGVSLMKACGVDSDDPAALRAVPAAVLLDHAHYDLTFGFILDGKAADERPVGRVPA